jgi:hypothetical protein
MREEIDRCSENEYDSDGGMHVEERFISFGVVSASM